MSEVIRCVPYKRFCKRGHPLTKETTFERKARQGDKTYIGRECRICHSMKNGRSANPTPKSKWSRYLAEHGVGA